jgi:hypothetical protein
MVNRISFWARCWHLVSDSRCLASDLKLLKFQGNSGSESDVPMQNDCGKQCFSLSLSLSFSLFFSLSLSLSLFFSLFLSLSLSLSLALSFRV